MASRSYNGQIEPAEYFVHLPEYRVIVCRTCRYAVRPASADRHLKEIHLLHRLKRRPLTDYLRSLDLLDDAQDVAPPHADRFPVPALQVQQGLQCSFHGCGHLCLSEKRMKSHWNSAEQHSACEQPGWTNVAVQTFFKGNQLRYFTGGSPEKHGSHAAKFPSNDPSQVANRNLIPIEAVVLVPDLNSGVLSESSTATLLQHYQTSTCFTISSDGETEELWKTTAVEMAYDHEFLMDGIIALASLHLAYLDKAKRPQYDVVASFHQNKAISAFRAAMAEPNSSNCHAIFVFTHLLVMYSFAAGKDDESLLLVTDEGNDVLPTWLYFIRSGCSMLCDVWDLVENGPCKLLVLAWESFVEIDKLDKIRCMELLESIMPNLGVESMLSEHDSAVYKEAATQLATAYACSCSSAMRQAFTAWDALRIWPVSLSEEFMSLLRESNPEALILLALYAALLKPLEQNWFFEGRATNLIRAIRHKLDDRWRQIMDTALDAGLAPQIKKRHTELMTWDPASVL